MQPHSRKRWRKRSKNHEIMGALWMIGMGLLFITGWWWPGILILMGVISVVGAATNEWKWDGEPEPEPEERPSRPAKAAPLPSPFTPAEPVARVEPAPQPQPANLRLPEFCPCCGAPTKALRQFAAHPEECAFCGSAVGA